MASDSLGSRFDYISKALSFESAIPALVTHTKGERMGMGIDIYLALRMFITQRANLKTSHRGLVTQIMFDPYCELTCSHMKVTCTKIT